MDGKEEMLVDEPAEQDTREDTKDLQPELHTNDIDDLLKTINNSYQVTGYAYRDENWENRSQFACQDQYNCCEWLLLALPRALSCCWECLGAFSCCKTCDVPVEKSTAPSKGARCFRRFHSASVWLIVVTLLSLILSVLSLVGDVIEFRENEPGSVRGEEITLVLLDVAEIVLNIVFLYMCKYYIKYRCMCFGTQRPPLNLLKHKAVFTSQIGIFCIYFLTALVQMVVVVFARDFDGDWTNATSWYSTLCDAVILLPTWGHFLWRLRPVAINVQQLPHYCPSENPKLQRLVFLVTSNKQIQSCKVYSQDKANTKGKRKWEQLCKKFIISGRLHDDQPLIKETKVEDTLIAYYHENQKASAQQCKDAIEKHDFMACNPYSLVIAAECNLEIVTSTVTLTTQVKMAASYSRQNDITNLMIRKFKDMITRVDELRVDKLKVA